MSENGVRRVEYKYFHRTLPLTCGVRVLSQSNDLQCAGLIQGANMKRHSRRRQIQGGFTLVELLIVIAIIGILAAILFPVFGRIRETARATACASNMKQLGLGFAQYTSDHGGRMPYGGNFQGWGSGAHWVGGENGKEIASLTDFKPIEEPPAGSGKYRTAQVEKGALYTYVKDAKVFVCPSNPDGQIKKLSYSMNCAISGISMNRISTPSEIVLLADEERANDGFFFAFDTTLKNAAGESTDAVSATIHNGAGNLLYVDGHAKPLIFKAFPLDPTDEGKKNKGKMSGSPRFHDRQFGGKFGTAQTGFDNGSEVNFKLNACAQDEKVVEGTPLP
jgi:prepilin-type N-terminal cleavage/methylation domain-containing protein/prepilin-type processing-associated H-X9-DG protein